MPELTHQELTSDIIGAYYEVYNHTPRTHPEHICERAMVEELRLRGRTATQQDEYRILYKERLVGVQRLDLFAAQEVAVEIKVVERLTRLHKAQCTLSASFNSNDLKKSALPDILFHKSFDSGGIQYERAD